MLIDVQPSRGVSLDHLLSGADFHDYSASFGDDIDAAHVELLDPAKTHSERCAALMTWASKYQPCLFGRLGARGMKGVGIDVCWIDEGEIALGDNYIVDKIQLARRAWKRHAAEGGVHGFLIVFNGKKLAHLRPGIHLMSICEKISNLYLVEHAPIERDVVYTESVPLRLDGLKLFKAGINIFYPSAHRTRNHDRRIPGGLVISVNSPGHWANSLVKRSLADDLTEAVDQAMDTALRSIGNGGIGHDETSSSSWHSREKCPLQLSSRRVLSRLPRYIPEDHSQRSYSALYHTDVLVPTDVTLDGTLDPEPSGCETWGELILDYISSESRTPDHINYALFHGHSIFEEAVYHNPWPPRRASNHPLKGDTPVSSVPRSEETTLVR